MIQMIWIGALFLFLISNSFVFALNNFVCFYNHSDPNCISLVQHAWNLTRQQILSKIENIQSLFDYGLLYLDPHGPYQPLDLAVGCLASRRFPYDTDCSQCEYCPIYKPRMCALFCPPYEAATSSISIRQTTTPRPHLPSASSSSTLPIEHFPPISIVSSSLWPYLLQIVVGLFVGIVIVLFAAMVYFCFFKFCRMWFVLFVLCCLS